ncbi:BMP family lipoprotein [Acetonema longum]|uniref:Basic membrane lipoprotein n=1 Tax=Acetonema longum DSM 6540 TaxID=1009370 RepID=F7NJW6_9FIRM|nr:BMP family ABC transporter substrate-binding protein [Acetonema longum]EGO63613.1 basic membrane lipoprotein [Acetonema longum DSM 6540]
MSKKGLFWLTLMLALTLVLAGCSGKQDAKAPGTGNLMVGMVTDAGSIDDKSFNQGTWEGIVKAGKDFGFTPKYLKPGGTTTADYEKEIANLSDAGYSLIITPGFKFENAIFTAQEKYPDKKFVLMDGVPRSSDGSNVKVGPNTVSINFAEQEAGFIAAVAGALQIKTGEFGFIGGMEIPPIKRFNWGFQQGIAYANANLGTKITLKAENVIYQGTFHDVAAGQQLAAQMYDKGVSVVFAAAGGVGTGVINEAVTRTKAGKEVWMIGVDVDQYAQGYYDADKTKSVVLTSAMKCVDQAAYDMVKGVKEGTFPGGKTLTFDVKNNGVGIPAANPNLTGDVTTKVKEVFAGMQSGKIIVTDKGDGLIR